jgi:hypothetical protein
VRYLHVADAMHRQLGQCCAGPNGRWSFGSATLARDAARSTSKLI